MAYPIQTYDDLLNLIKASGRSFDLDQIEHAYQVAAEAHKEQKRKRFSLRNLFFRFFHY